MTPVATHVNKARNLKLNLIKMVLLPHWEPPLPLTLPARERVREEVRGSGRWGGGACAASISLHIHFLAHSFNFERVGSAAGVNFIARFEVAAKQMK